MQADFVTAAGGMVEVVHKLEHPDNTSLTVFDVSNRDANNESECVNCRDSGQL
jgi:hypothetical protein